MHPPKVTLLLVAAGLGALAIIAVWQMRPAASPAAVERTFQRLQNEKRLQALG
jgi:hypothetical protein